MAFVIFAQPSGATAAVIEATVVMHFNNIASLARD
jgi:hypothetical protein